MAELDTRRNRIMALWLFGMCVMVFVMVVLGGLTRLTHSGLSIVEWNPVTGFVPPLNEADWQRLFEQYQQYPEFKKVNAGMDLQGFKGIFWLEFVHRVWGRMMGLAFFFPALFFVLRGWVDRRLGRHFAGMFLLGGLQGALGWFMVASGLVDNPDVSHYRLTAHLGAAVAIFAYMLWIGMDLMSPERHLPVGALSGHARRLAGLVFLTILSGGLVAGLDAGFSYNTFPLMDGRFVPDGYLDHSPWWINFFENLPAVQFDHRILAESTLALILAFWWKARQAGLSRRAHLAVNALALAVTVQVALGIATLLLVVPVGIAATHQAGAVVLLAAALWAAHALRPEER
ncbi:MAG: COX15/CtaA family protein [Magnetospirillum sp. WYHS-4]